MPIGKKEVENRFGFHKATIEGDNATLPLHRDTRAQFRELAEWMDVVLPDGRAKSVMFTELETASMWAHKAIAEHAPLVQEEVSKAELALAKQSVEDTYGPGEPVIIEEDEDE